MVYFASGRHGAMDGGWIAYCVNLEEGTIEWRTEVKDKPMRCDLAIRSKNGLTIFKDTFDFKTGERARAGREDLYGDFGLLSPYLSVRNAHQKNGRRGHLLNFDDKTVYGMMVQPHGRDGKFTPGNKGYELFVAPMRGKSIWKKRIDLRTLAMVVTGETIIVAGIPDVVGPQDDYWAAFDGKLGGRILAFNARDGTKLSQLKTGAAPVRHGLSSAGGFLYAVTTDGRLTCYGRKPKAGQD